MSHTHLSPHGHHDKDDYETANQHHFDAIAHEYNNIPHAQNRAARIGRAMVATGLFRPGITTVMDFACGTGLLSRVLAAENPKLIVGVDISQGMVDQYNKVVSDHGIPPEEMRAVCLQPHERLQDLSFDVIVCASAYHHFTSIDEVTTMLANYLNPGGSLLVADLVHGEGTHQAFPENVQHIVVHKEGFTKEDIWSAFERAALKNITFEIIGRANRAGRTINLFLTRGDK